MLLVPLLIMQQADYDNNVKPMLLVRLLMVCETGWLE